METQTAESIGIVLPRDSRGRQEEVERYVAASVQMLADDLSKGASENMLKLLAFFARLHTYSAKNKLLIMLQKPDASYVASYTRWKQLDRQVAKGSKAIYIYGPVTRKEQDAVTGERADRILGFRLLPVFDATSTRSRKRVLGWTCECLRHTSTTSLPDGRLTRQGLPRPCTSTAWHE